MMRLGFVLWPLGIILVAIGLFQIKYSVQAIDREILRVDQQLKNRLDYEAVLTTEWEYRTQPAALETLARTHLGLRGDQGTIVTSLDRLPYRPASDSLSLAPIPWQSGALSEQVEEAPATGLTAFRAPEPSELNGSLDNLQSLITELEDL